MTLAATMKTAGRGRAVGWRLLLRWGAATLMTAIMIAPRRQQGERAGDSNVRGERKQ